MEWKYKEIIKTSFDTVFRKGFKAWIILVVAGVFFSALGSDKFSQANLFTKLDEVFGLDSFISYRDTSVLEEYAAKTKIGRFLNDSDWQGTDDIVSSLASRNPFLLAVANMNKEYMKRNSGEVIGIMIFVVILMGFINNVIIRALEVGKARFVVENRFQKNGRFRRIFAPFGKKFWNIIRVEFIYSLIMSLWAVTIVGFIYKVFQYMMVPYLLAEDPSLSWKEVKRLSKEMTKGYKWKMFLNMVMTAPLFLLSIIPGVNILVSQPYYMQLEAEFYIRLRSRTDIDRKAFTEPVFDGPAYVDAVRDAVENDSPMPAELPEYQMHDIMLNITDFDSADKYKITDYIVMFFAFNLVGYLWEVGIHIVKDHAFVNRGMMYGPWIPIYGFGGVFIIFFLNRFKNSKPKLIILTMLLCGVLEYLTSLVIDFTMNASYWDYKSMSFNINGRVCLAGLCAFAIGGFAGIYLIGPAIRGGLERFGTKRTRILCSVLLGAFFVDFICCRVFGSNSGEGIGGAAGSVVQYLCMLSGRS